MLPTVSKFSLAEECLASCEPVPVALKRNGSPYAEPGYMRVANAVHAIIALVAPAYVGYRDDAAWQRNVPLEGLTPKMRESSFRRVHNFVDWWLDAERTGRRAIAEPAFAIDPLNGSARVLGCFIDRRYAEHGAKPGEICGTADIVVPGDMPWVIDVKTGFTGVDAPPDNGQLLTLAYAVARVAQVPRVRVSILRLSEESAIELPRGGYVHDALDFDDAEGRMLRVVQDHDAGDRTARAGTHCVRLHCGHRPTCAAFQAWKATAA